MSKIDIAEELHYKFIHWSLIVSGLWPFQSSEKNSKFRIVTYIILITYALPQLLTIQNRSGKSLDAVVESMGIFMCAFYCLAKYSILCFHRKKLSFLLNKLSDLKTVSNKEEVKIISECSKIRRLYATIHIAYPAVGTIAIMMVDTTVLLVDVFSQSENITQMKVFENRGDYIIDLDDHPFLKNMHLYFGGGFAVFTHEGFDLAFLFCFAHTCTLIRILCHKLSNIGKGFKDNNKEVQLISKAELRQEIKSIVQIHCEIFKCVHALEKVFGYAHLSSLFLCILLVPISSLVMQYCLTDRPLMAIQVLIFCLAFALELFFLNLAGQRLINESEQIIESANWYKIPFEYRKSLRLIMIHSVQPMQLSAGKVIILSAAAYASAMKSVVSYLTILLTIF